jgi:antitoxin (DNA-binding transcriptional repressor) of toxin-antitoxin stability system
LFPSARINQSNWQTSAVSVISVNMNQFPELIDRAFAGEADVITLNGRAAVELKPFRQWRTQLRLAELDWLAQHRIGRLSVRDDSGSLVSRMRDEDEPSLFGRRCSRCALY